MNCPIKFKVGDRVVATDALWRQDKRTTLLKGDHAIVREVFERDRDPVTGHASPQIITLAVEGGDIGDIVCFEKVPLKLA